MSASQGVRLRQIRERVAGYRQGKRYDYPPVEDIDFLLSLVKSQEAVAGLWQPIEAAPKSDTIWLVVAKIADREPDKGGVLWWYRAMFWRGAWRTSRDYSGSVEPTHFFNPEQITAPLESVSIQEQK